MSGRAHPDAASCWTLEGTTARLACGGLAGVVELGEPWGGLRNFGYDGKPLGGWLLGVTVASAEDERPQPQQPGQPWAPTDVYVRGRDLVATYGETPGRPFSLQIYWRVHEPGGGAGPVVDAIVSVQTRAWEAFPEVGVCSALATEAVEVVRGNDAHVIGVALRPAGASWSFVESSPVGDFVASQVEIVEGGLRCVGWKYGRHFMERGVIRRLRLRGAFVQREGDEQAVRRLHEDLSAEHPPLTA